VRRTDPSRPAKVPHLSFVHGRRGVDSCLSRQSGVEVFVRQPGILASNLGKMPWALGLAVGILAPNAWGQSATTMTARELAKQGIEAYDAGRYQEASTILLQALDVVEVPTLAVYAARALTKQGKLVLAAEVYLRGMRLRPTSDWQPVQKEMQQTAATERQALLGRIAKLHIAITGAQPADVTVTLDGTKLPTALLRVEQMVDPGTRHVQARRGSEVVDEEVMLREGQIRSIELHFKQTAVPLGSDASPSAVASNSSPSQDSSPASSSGIRPIITYSALGVGAAGIVLGSVTGLMAVAKRSSLKNDGCVDNECYTDQQGEIDSYDTLRTLSTVGFVVGAVGAAAGITLLLTAPEPGEPNLALELRPGHAQLSGSF